MTPAFSTKTHHDVSPSDDGTQGALTMTPDADAIADCVLSTFDGLPDKRKPRPRSHGSREWVPLSGIVLSKSNHPTNCWTRLVA